MKKYVCYYIAYEYFVCSSISKCIIETLTMEPKLLIISWVLIGITGLVLLHFCVIWIMITIVMQVWDEWLV